jgi:ubiquitin-protein ligase
MASSSITSLCRKRLHNELVAHKKQPLFNIDYYPQESNILIWHFCIVGCDKDTPYYGGVYVGRITHVYNYPLGAPSICMLTPSGKFDPGKQICLTNTGLHNEQWSEAWTMNTILIGLLSIMNEDTAKGTNFVCTTSAEKKKSALASHEYNRAHLSEIYKEFRFIASVSRGDKDSLELIPLFSESDSGNNKRKGGDDDDDEKRARRKETTAKRARV